MPSHPTTAPCQYADVYYYATVDSGERIRKDVYLPTTGCKDSPFHPSSPSAASSTHPPSEDSHVSHEHLRQRLAKPQILSFCVDQTVQSEVEDAAKRVPLGLGGSLDVIVNTAGYMDTWHHITESDHKGWRRAREVNVRGPYLICHSFLPFLLRFSYKSPAWALWSPSLARVRIKVPRVPCSASAITCVRNAVSGAFWYTTCILAQSRQISPSPCHRTLTVSWSTHPNCAATQQSGSGYRARGVRGCKTAL